ncbi:hypothetical protein GOBAR_AA11965 [Gossypium barbadense]|uniref:RPN1 N-terminal domain-containing protein n=1 Tax=Gossypium barbadense TaxID=3634 RepID=A0A2P5XZE3_GOSBA|nr:hypothetical protein GOBAR_AA11965 [Gossypium barbadense]
MECMHEDTLQQEGVCARRNRTVMNKETRQDVFEGKLSTKAVKEEKTPFDEQIFGSKDWDSQACKSDLVENKAKVENELLEQTCKHAAARMLAVTARILAGEISQEYLMRQVDYLDPLTEHVDITNFRRTCLYLTSVARYLMDPDDILFMNIAYSIYLMFYEFASALQIALFLDNLEHVYELFTSCDDLLMKKQFCCILSQQDDKDRELSQNIINNVKLSEGYLTIARDFEVMEPKCLEDVYKV